MSNEIQSRFLEDGDDPSDVIPFSGFDNYGTNNNLIWFKEDVAMANDREFKVARLEVPTDQDTTIVMKYGDEVESNDVYQSHNLTVKGGFIYPATN